MFGRQRVAGVAAEFIGAGALTLLILSVQRSTIGVPFFVAAAAGLTMALMVFALGGISNGFFNPAITLALWTARKVSSLNALLYIIAQFLGAWGAYYLYSYFVKNGLTPVGGHFAGRILVAEAVGAGIFGFGVAAAIYRGFSAAVTASFAGVALMLGAIAASSASIALLNPAVALGVRAWVWGTYVVGPLIGTLIGVNLYSLLFAEPATAAVAASNATAPAAATTRRTAVKKPASKRKTTTRAKKR